jgi:hypothetical protein
MTVSLMVSAVVALVNALKTVLLAQLIVRSLPATLIGTVLAVFWVPRITPRVLTQPFNARIVSVFPMLDAVELRIMLSLARITTPALLMSA